MKYKRMIFSVLVAFSTVPLYAVDIDEICMRNTLTMLSINQDKDGVVTENDTSRRSWAVDFDYNMFSDNSSRYASEIVGHTACVDISVKSALAGNNSNAGTATPGDANTYLRVEDYDTGVHCWCKMSGPVTSYWVYLKTYDSASACDSDCNTYCVNGFANNSEMSNGRLMRHAIYNAIW